MKVAVFSKYGTSKNVEIIDVEIPEPSDTQVLVKIKAASLNATDIEIIRGDAIIRMSNGMFKPRNKRLGCDLSGVVEKIGNKVSSYKVGDHIYVDVMYQSPAYGAFAEYILVPEKRLRIKPETLSFEEAATIPQAGVLAIQGIIEPNPPAEGSNVLINGAGGAVGSFAIQLAKHYGAEVTAVDHPDKFEFMRSLGADHTVNYLEQDFTKLGIKYDIILDAIARKSLWAYRRALNPGGRYKMVGGTLRRLLGVGLFGFLTSKISSRDVGVLMGRPNDLELMKLVEQWHADGVIVPQISKTYPLEQIQNALKVLEEGKTLGKIVITMD